MKNNRTNPDHNIWNNNGTWWCRYAVHNDNRTKDLVRASLGTKDVAIARALRDFIMDDTQKIAARILHNPAKFKSDVRGNRVAVARLEYSSAAA